MSSTGTVKFYNDEKGFGFIQPEDGSKDLFFHRNDIIGSVSDNDKVKFVVTDTAKGPAASEVERV